MTDTVVARFGRWVAGLAYAGIPEDTRRAARYQIANMLAAAHAAHASHEAQQLDRGVAATSGSGRATVIATGAKLPPVEATLVNAAYSMAHDYDDIIWTGHTCHSAVFAALAVAEHEGASAEELIVAVVAANEVAGRLAASAYFGPLNGQMVSYIHHIGAAAATARVLRLDETRTSHALAISLMQPNFLLQPGFFRPTTKLLTASTPAASGVRAAYFAREGATGALEIVEDRRGFWRRFAFQPLPGMLGQLGEFWALQTLGIKTFPGCYYFQTACTALQRLAARHGGELALDDVAAIEIETTKLATEVTRFGSEYAAGDITPVTVDFDLAQTAAILLHAKRFTAHEHDEAWLAANAAALRAWCAKITVRHDPVLTAKVLEGAAGLGTARDALKALRPLEIARLVRRYRAEYASTLIAPGELLGWVRAAFAPRAPAPSSRSAIPLYFPSRVTLRLRDGSRDTEQVDLPAGSFCSPTVEAELRDKLVRESTATLGADGAARAFAMLLALESHTVPDLVRACSP